MRILPILTATALVPLVSAACDKAPTSTVAGNSDVVATHVPGQPTCHDVQGRLQEEGFPNDLTGEVTGDLVGSTSGGLTGFLKTGKAGHNFGIRTYSITGGTVPALVGSEFTVEFVGINVGDGPVFPVHERAKATEGVREANLTAHGTIDTRAFPFVKLEFEYWGEVCP
jgi:hypothetical protein